MVIELAVGRFKNKAVVAACFGFLLFALAYTNPWSMDTARVTPIRKPMGGEWYERYMEFATRGQSRSSADKFAAATLVDAALEKAGCPQDVEFLFLANIRSASQNTVYRFLLRIAAKNPHFAFTDPIRDLERLCMRAVVPPWYLDPRPVPNVIVLDGVATRTPPSADDLVSVTHWRERFELDNDCLLHDPEDNASPDEIKKRLVDLLVVLPWDKYRMRTYELGPRAFVFDRPDLGVEVQLPPSAGFDPRANVP